MSEREVARRIEERLRETAPELFAREPRTRYWECLICGARFVYSTERAGGDGKFISCIYAPTGKGSRTGTADTLKQIREVRHRKRKDAKARAFRLHELHRKDKDRIAVAAHNRARREGREA